MFIRWWFHWNILTNILCTRTSIHTFTGYPVRHGTNNRGVVWGPREPWFYTYPSTFSLSLFIYQIWSSISSYVKLGKENKNTSYDHCKYWVNIDGVLYLVHSKCSIIATKLKKIQIGKQQNPDFYTGLSGCVKRIISIETCVGIYMCKSTSGVF